MKAIPGIKNIILFSIIILLFNGVGYSQGNSGFIYFTNAIDISHTTIGAWHDVNVSAHVPAGATGVVLELVNEGNEETASRHAVRNNGSSDARQEKLRISDHGHRYAFCGVDENRIFESYIETTSCKLYLLGYTNDYVTFYTNGIDKTPATINTWNEIDVSDIVPSGTKGIIIEAYSVNGNSKVGVRKTGTTDDRTGAGSNVYSYRNATFLYCGLDENRTFEGKITGADGKFSVVGYISSQVEFFDSAVKVSITAEDSWTDINLYGIIPSRANGVVFEINNDNNARRVATLRTNGSTDDRSAYSTIYNSGMAQGVCGIDGSNILEAFINNQSVDIYIIGYTLPYDPTPPSNIASINDGTGSDIDNSYSIRELSANWSASVDAESGISHYLYTLGSTPGGTNIVDWTSNGNNTSASITGLSLTVGQTYYISVKAENGQGLQSAVITSDGVTIIADPSSPATVSEVRDGLSADIASSYPTGKLSANWNESSDPESGIYRYWYAIGTSQGGTDVIDWTDNGIEKQITVEGISLIEGTTYYTSVRAENKAGILGATTSSNGVEIVPDPTPPTNIAEVRDGYFSDIDNIYYTDRLAANWNPSIDNESGVLHYLYAIGTTKGGTDMQDWTDNSLDTTVFLDGLSLTVGTTYYISVMAGNGSGAYSSVTTSDGVLVKEMDPNIYVVECPPGSDISDDIQDGADYLIPAGGGIIYLPEGDFQFDDPVEMPGGISLIGMGQDKTILRSEDGTNFLDINHSGDNGGSFRISGISFIGHNPGDPANPVQLGIGIHNIVNFRIDHCFFNNFKYVISIGSHYYRPELPQSCGVIDHCSFIRDTNSLYESMYGITDTRVWQEDMRMGTNEATFVEDCFFTGCSHPTDAFGGGHYVLRFSEMVNNASVGGHGPGFDASGRGTRCTEIYNNLIKKTDVVGYDYRWLGMNVRAGGGVVYNNIFDYCRYGIQFTLDSPGSFVDDDHDGIPDYPVLDQNREKWIWNNTLVNTPQLIMHYGDFSEQLIQEDRDYFLREPSYDLDGFSYEPYIYPHPLVSDPIFGDKELSFSSKVISICKGESYFAQGEDQIESGIYIDTLKATRGGDSLIITNLRVYPIYRYTNINIKTGESYYAGGSNQTTAGTYIDHIGTVNGCDSLILTTHLTINNINTINHNQISMANIYPNPSSGLFYLNINPREQPIIVKVISAIGQQVYYQEYTFAETGFTEEVDLSQYKSGVYFVEILSQIEFELHKILVIK